MGDHIRDPDSDTPLDCGFLPTIRIKCQMAAPRSIKRATEWKAIRISGRNRKTQISCQQMETTPRVRSANRSTSVVRPTEMSAAIEVKPLAADSVIEVKQDLPQEQQSIRSNYRVATGFHVLNLSRLFSARSVKLTIERKLLRISSRNRKAQISCEQMETPRAHSTDRLTSVVRSQRSCRRYNQSLAGRR